MAKAEYGDIIYTKHNLYRHYGIYINENCVVHYDGKLDDMFLRKDIKPFEKKVFKKNVYKRNYYG